MEPASKTPLNRYPLRHGFTLLELLTVTAIVMVVGSISAYNFQNALIKSKIASVYTKSRQLSDQYILFQVDTNLQPVKNSSSISGGHDISITNQSNDVSNILRQDFQTRLPSNCLVDPFTTHWSDRSVFLGLPSTKIKSIFSFEESQSLSLVIVSKGPDGEIARISSIFEYDGMIYEPTNGITSCGDIFRLIPQNKTPTFIY